MGAAGTAEAEVWKEQEMAKTCYKCGLPLAFKKLPSGKWYPTNPDGSDHWDLCREVTNGTIDLNRLTRKQVTHTVKNIGKVKETKVFAETTKGKQVMVGLEGFVVTGPAFVSACDCKFNIPPWEECTQCRAQQFN